MTTESVTTKSMTPVARSQFRQPGGASGRFPAVRPRRLRASEALRSLVRETDSAHATSSTRCSSPRAQPPIVQSRRCRA